MHSHSECLLFKSVSVTQTVLLCPWQVGGGLSSEVLQQPSWHPLWPQIHHISVWSAQVNIQALRPTGGAHTLMNMGTPWHLCFCCGRFVQYKATSLEKQHKHELLTEPDLGVTIDLINPDTYRIDPNSKSLVVVACDKLLVVFFQTWLCFVKCQRRLNPSFKFSVLLDPADEKLLEEDIQAPASSKRWSCWIGSFCGLIYSCGDVLFNSFIFPIRSQQHAKVVPWMRKTEYISTEFNRYGVSNEKVEVK